YRSPGIDIQSSNKIIESNTIFDVWYGYGIRVWKQDSTSLVNNTIRGNKIHDVPTNAGIMVSSGSGHKVYSNIVYLTSTTPFSGYHADGGIAIRSGDTYGITLENNPCTNCYIYNNTVTQNGGDAGIFTNAGSVGTYIRN